MSPTPAPLVSILLPTFEAGSTLGACLRSIQRQSLTGWECVIVDDGSTDVTPSLVRDAAARDVRFRLVPTAHAGLVPALNEGLSRCRGTYVARMDADDLMHRTRLEDQVALLETGPDLAAVGCHVRLFPRRDLGPGYRAYEGWLNAIDSADLVEREAFVECPVAHPTLMARATCIKQLGYRDRGWPEDYDLVLRLLASGRRVGVLPRRRLLWRHRENRLSLTDPAYGIDRFTALKASFLAGSFLSRTDRYVLWGYGGTGRALRRALAEHGRVPSHIVELHRGRLGNRIHGALVVPPSRLPDLPRRPLIVSVAGTTARTEIRAKLTQMGFEETRDYVCAA